MRVVAAESVEVQVGNYLGLHFYDFCGVLAAWGENRTQMSARGRKVQV